MVNRMQVPEPGSPARLIVPPWAGGGEGDRAVRVGHHEVGDHRPGQGGQIQGRELRRPAPVQPGEQREIVDQQTHPDQLGLDPAHRPIAVRRVGQATLQVQLHPAGGGRQRRPQLVRGVGHEVPQATQLDPSLTLDELPSLAQTLTLPAGWQFGTQTLDEQLNLATGGTAYVVNDNVANSYQKRTDLDTTGPTG